MSDMEPSDGEGSEMRFLHNSDDDDDEELRQVIAPSEDEDDDDDGEDVPPPSDDEDEDEDDDEDEKAVPQKKQQKMSAFFQGAQPTASSKAKGSTSAAGKKTKPAAGIAAATKKDKSGTAPAAGKNKATNKLLEPRGSDEEDSDAETPTRPGSGPKRKQLELSSAAADPFEEHDQLRRQYANGAASKGAAEADAGTESHGGLPKVNLFQIAENTFVVKNDKGPQAKRFWKVNAEKACMHAPNYKGTTQCALAMKVETYMQTRKEREAMLATMANDPAKLEVLAQEAMIFDVRMDPSGNGCGPGIVNVAGFLPYRLEDTEEAMEALYNQYLEPLDPVGAAEFELSTLCTFLVPIDEKLMKKIIKAGKGTFPRMYDANRLSCVKYRVIAKMDEQAKIDDNFTHVPPPSKAGKSKRKRGAAATGADGAATDKKSKAAESSSSGGAQQNGRANGHGTDDEDADDEDEGSAPDPGGPSDPCFSRIKWTPVPSLGIELAGIKCGGNFKLNVHPVGGGRFMLVKTPA